MKSPITHIRFMVFSLLAGLFMFGQTSFAQEALSKESKLKAAYLFNFTKYIEWPDTAFSNDQDAVQICLVADPAFSAFMKALTNGRKVGASKRDLVVSPLGAGSSCHLIYVHVAPQEAIPSYPNSLLVVGDEQIELTDTTITFFKDSGKLRFEIDRKVLDASQVIVSSELLKLARIK